MGRRRSKGDRAPAPVKEGVVIAAELARAVDDIKTRIDEASPSLLLSVRNYETKNKNRKTIIDLTERETVGS